METVLLAVGMFLAGIIAGVFIGNKLKDKKHDGTIFLELNENGDERIRWYLGMEYEDIPNHKQITFDVVNNMPVK